MRRFFCTVCKKVKRVQKWPLLIENTESMDPELRIGECNRHSVKSPVWSEANKIQAEGRINRANIKVRKVR